MLKPALFAAMLLSSSVVGAEVIPCGRIARDQFDFTEEHILNEVATGLELHGDLEQRKCDTTTGYYAGVYYQRSSVSSDNILYATFHVPGSDDDWFGGEDKWYIQAQTLGSIWSQTTSLTQDEHDACLALLDSVCSVLNGNGSAP